jgi:hypothetical protein
MGRGKRSFWINNNLYVSESRALVRLAFGKDKAALTQFGL